MKRSDVCAPAVLVLLTAVLLAAWFAASPARASCSVPLGNETDLEEESACGPVNPPSHVGTIGAPPGTVTPRIIAWVSGYDINPVGGFRGGIFVAKVSGNERRKITTFTHLNHDFEPHGLNLPDDHPSFSPDSKKLVFTSNRLDRNDWDIYSMNVNGSGATRLNAASGLDTEPVYSPNGAKIAFTTARYGNLDIAVMNADGTNVQQLTTSGQEDIEPAWSPNGTQIAFSRVQSKNEKDVFVMNADGSSQRQVTFTSGQDHDPTFSPNGQELAITSERDFSPPYGNVHRIRVSDGADLGDLTSDLAFGAGDPFWSKDGGLIAFFHAAGPNLRSPQRLFIMDNDGSDKIHIPGETPVNVHAAIGLGVDEDSDGTPNYLESGSVGETHLAPRHVRAGRRTVVHFLWKHPVAWRKLDTLYLSLDDGKKVLGVVRHNVADKSFSLYKSDDREYTDPKLVGHGRVRSGPVKLDLKRTRIKRLDTQRLRLDLALTFSKHAGGKRYRVNVQADDLDGQNQIERLGRLRIKR